MQSPFAISKKLIFKRLSFFSGFLKSFIIFSVTSINFWGDKKRLPAPGDSGEKEKKKFFSNLLRKEFFVPFRLFSGAVVSFLLHNWLPFLNDHPELNTEDENQNIAYVVVDVWNIYEA